MSDTKDKKDKTEKKKSKVKPLILASLVALLAGIGATLYFFPDLPAKTLASMARQPEPIHAAEEVIPDPIFLALEPFTVTLRDDMDSRVLYIGLTLRLSSDDSKKRIEKYLPMARSRVLAELNSVSPSSIGDKASLDKLRSAVQRTVSEPFQPERMSQDVVEVLITSMVAQ